MKIQCGMAYISEDFQLCLISQVTQDVWQRVGFIIVFISVHVIIIIMMSCVVLLNVNDFSIPFPFTLSSFLGI